MTTISGQTRVAAVIGTPVRHSLSPALHNAAFEEAGLDWRFLAFEVAPGAAGEAIAAMRTLGIGGYAVTMPHKADVAAAVDEVDPAAAALGAVNTVVLRDDGSTFGVNTDGAGFVASVGAAGIDLEESRVVVLGAGGAARSIIDALGRAGVADVSIVNRTRSSADAAARLSPVARVGHLGDLDGADLLVNATSVGMGTEELAVDISALRPDLAVADIVYHPLETALLSAATALGAPTIDGLGMLVHQAAVQQQLWTGRHADPAVMRRAAEAELAARSV